MSLTRTQARDEIFAVAQSAIIAYDGAFKIIWHDADDVNRPKTSQPWAEVSLYHIGSYQATMGDAGNRTFRRHGFVEILVYTPEGDGLTLADALAIVAQDALEGVTTPGGVIFRNAGASEAGKSGISRVTNVRADFEYDQIK